MKAAGGGGGEEWGGELHARFEVAGAGNGDLAMATAAKGPKGCRTLPRRNRGKALEDYVRNIFAGRDRNGRFALRRIHDLEADAGKRRGKPAWGGGGRGGEMVLWWGPLPAGHP